MPRKKVIPIAEEPEAPKSRFADVFKKPESDEPEAEAVVVTPETERAEAIAERLSGTPTGREMLAEVLTGAVDKTVDALAAFLTKLEGYAEGIDTVTAADGTEYKLITLSDLTGWRRREAWKILTGLKVQHTVWSNQKNEDGDKEYNLFTAIGEVAASDKAVRLLGIAYGPVGVPYDREKAEEYAHAVDDQLTTKQIAGMVIRFFSLSASSIAHYSRSYLEGLVNQAAGALLTIFPTKNGNAAEG
jgi:hypothetical protein